jgi:hypothetical protein
MTLSPFRPVVNPSLSYNNAPLVIASPFIWPPNHISYDWQSELWIGSSVSIGRFSPPTLALASRHLWLRFPAFFHQAAKGVGYFLPHQWIAGVLITFLRYSAVPHQSDQI